jgi:signal transduction histidine kinase
MQDSPSRSAADPGPIPKIAWHRRLEARVLAAVTLIAGTSLAAALFAASGVIGRYSLARSTEDLAAARVAFDHLVESRGRFATAETRLITELPVFRANLDPASNIGADAATITTMAEEYRQKLGADFCIVTDARGSWIGNPGWVRNEPRRALAPFIDQARGGRSVDEIVPLTGALYLVVSEPARFADEVLGTMTAGYKLDDRVARDLSLVTHTEVNLVCSGYTLCGSSLAHTARAGLADALAANAIPHDTPALRQIGSDQYVSAAYALARDDADGSRGGLVLLRAWAPTERAIRQMRRWLLWVGVAMLLVTLAGSFAVSRRLTRPLTYLAEVARDIATGNWTREVPVDRGTSEARIMATAFNDMTRTLRHWHHEARSQAERVQQAYDSFRAAQEQLRDREEQLRQAQKMEAVGRLAGGIAHDFNNLLTAILGYADFLIEDVPAASRTDVANIQKAGRTAVAMTRQLLAFSRKQVVQTEIINVNAVVSSTEKLLRRLLPEDIDVRLELQPDLSTIQADPGQIEQIVLNLAVNSRDAMPDGGGLIIETSSAVLPHGVTTGGVALEPGRYVVLSVTDTGVGMTDDVRTRIFEPFFTTKPFGKGTGLGLATVYGVVQQLHGAIDVDSVPGAGTTFRVHIPSVDAEAAARVNERADTKDCTGTETVLVVEDNDSVRALTTEALTRGGYRVVEARHGEEGIRAAQERSGAIHLVITDMVMPIMGGRALASRLRILYPNLRILFTSAYMDETHAIEPGTPFIQKPYSPSALLRCVRDLLDRDVDVGSAL